MSTPPRHSTTPDFHHRFADVGPGLHYVDSVCAERPMLLVHGIGMDWRVWQAISRRLAPRFHLYAIDLRGHGGSGKPERGYSLADYAADIEDLIEVLGLQDVTLVGSSLGGAVCAVVEAPIEMVSHRVLVDPPLTLGPIHDEQMLRAILLLKHQPETELARYLFERNPGIGRHLATVMSQMWHNAADGVIEEMLASPHEYYRMDRELRNVESPTLLMQADPTRDAVLSAEKAHAVIKLLPHGELVTVRGAGHAIHAFKPAEFVSLVERFTSPPGQNPSPFEPTDSP